jgi:hypothetical protein
MAYTLADPSSKLDFSHDWTDWLVAGETIVSRQWSIVPTTATLTGATTNVVFVEGMVAGTVYHLTEQILTNGGVIDQKTIVIRCEDT